jgi:hypothetical protein
MPFWDQLTSHARRQARRRGITEAELEDVYFDPDDVRPSHHDENREIRGRWFAAGRVEIVVDTLDGRVVSAWRKRTKK